MKIVKKSKAIIIYFLIVLSALFFLEFLSRIFIYTVTKEKQIFKYGLKKNIEFTVSSFSNLEFIVVDHMIFKKKKKIKKKN